MAKNLKAYLRYTEDGRIVPGGNISSRKAPKVGRWKEIPINSCCTPTPHNICVSGFTTFTNLNGTYEYIGTADGRPHYQKSGPYDVYWNTDRWWIGEWAYSTDDVQFPYLVTTWEIHPLEEGEISVVEGNCSSTPSPTPPPSNKTCVTYRFIMARGTCVLSYTDCEGTPSGEISLSAPVDMTFCAEYDSVLVDGDGELTFVSEECTTTTTTSTSTTTTTSSTTTTTTTEEPESTTTTTTTTEEGT